MCEKLSPSCVCVCGEAWVCVCRQQTSNIEIEIKWYEQSDRERTKKDANVRLLNALKHIDRLHWEWHHDDGILCTIQPRLYYIRVFSLHTDCSNTKRNESGEQTIRIWDDNDDPITLKYAISNLQFCTYMNMSSALWALCTLCIVHCAVRVYSLWLRAAKVTHSHAGPFHSRSLSHSVYLTMHWAVAKQPSKLAKAIWRVQTCERVQMRNWEHWYDRMSVCMT